jgi:type I restriction enzyme S subunit
LVLLVTLFRQWFIERCPKPVEGEAKEDWEDCTIEDLAIHSKLSVHPNRNPDTLYHHYSIPAFDANKKPVVELGKEIQSNKYKVEENSILFSKLNPHKDKRVWLIQDNVEEHAICSTELQVVKPKDKDYLYFIYGWLTNSIYYNEIASGVGGTSGSHQRIEPKAIFTAPCVKIEKDIILQYNSHAEPLFKKQFENQQQIQTLTQLRDTLLPKLMSGEVRVKV